jgi:hypothetical protein
MLIQFKFGHFLASFTDFDRLCKLEKREDEIKKNLLLWNYWANLNQTLLKWFLGGPLPKLCPAFLQLNLTSISYSFWNITQKVLKFKKILIEGPNRLTHFWKRTTQWLFHQNFNLNCISIMMSFLTYIMGFFMNFELLPILIDYAN